MSTAKDSAPPGLEGLVDLACRSGVDVRPTMLRVLTDFYVPKPSHSQPETAQFLELALRLVDVVDPATRGVVAARLVGYPDTPAVLLQRLVDLKAIPHLPELSSAPATTQRPQATQSNAAAAKALPAVSAPPLAPAAPAAASASLADRFMVAAPADRAQMLRQLGAGRQVSRHASRPDAGQIATRLEAAALERNTAEFASVLERSLFVSRDNASRMVADKSGEPLIIVGKAIGMTAGAMQRVLLFLNPAIGSSVQQVYRLSDLFHEVSAGACEALLDAFRGNALPQRPPHQPVYWDDERQRARAAATTAPRTAGRRTEPLSDRLRNSGR